LPGQRENPLGRGGGGHDGGPDEQILENSSFASRHWGGDGGGGGGVSYYITTMGGRRNFPTGLCRAGMEIVSLTTLSRPMLLQKREGSQTKRGEKSRTGPSRGAPHGRSQQPQQPEPAPSCHRLPAGGKKGGPQRNKPKRPTEQRKEETSLLPLRNTNSTRGGRRTASNRGGAAPEYPEPDAGDPYRLP